MIRRDKGQVAIEFILTSGLIVMLAAGAVQFYMIFRTQLYTLEESRFNARQSCEEVDPDSIPRMVEVSAEKTVDILHCFKGVFHRDNLLIEENCYIVGGTDQGDK
jgi:hypothetical protein